VQNGKSSAEVARLFDPVADLRFDDLINYLISRSMAMNGN
jgi:hypothetical protein